MRTVSLIDMLSRMVSSPRQSRNELSSSRWKRIRGLADTLDQVEQIGAFLVAHGIAEDTSEQPDIVAQLAHPLPAPELSAERPVTTIRVGRSVLGTLPWGDIFWEDMADCCRIARKSPELQLF